LQRYEKSRAEQNKFIYFLCRDRVIFAILMAKVIKNQQTEIHFADFYYFTPNSLRI